MPLTKRPQKSKPQAEFLDAMKVLAVPDVPDGDWRSEIKYDGYRVIVVLNQGSVELWSRNRKSMNEDYPGLVSALSKLRCRNAVLDGEIVALDEEGRSRFQLLQNNAPDANLRLFLFDVLWLEGEDLRATPLERRQERLATLLASAKTPLQLSTWFENDPAEVLQAAKEQGLEGIVAKRCGSAYESGKRTGAWVKCKLVNEQEFVIGGYTSPRNARAYFGAILVGYYEGGELFYAGKVGSGYAVETLRDLHGRFQSLISPKIPFVNLPLTKRPRFGTGMTAAALKEITWLKPRLVAQVKFSEWTSDGLLRQPVFLGLREDKAAIEVTRSA